MARVQTSGSSSNLSGHERPGVSLGSYQLLQEIAVGEFSVVHRARSMNADSVRREVAIKRPHDLSQHGPGRARILREARIGLSLRAPNLVRVLEIHDEQELYLVMEHVEGTTLQKLFAGGLEAISLRHLLPMFVEVLHGLSALHHWRDEEGAPSFLVHQAPTARHMLVGADGITRLIDLSHVDGPLLGPRAQHPQGAVFCEFAPEQLVARAELDPRCDVFLVGTALHGALERVGRDRACNEPRWRDKRAPLFDLCERARAAQRGKRFWSTEEMAYALTRAAKHLDAWAAPEEIGACVRAVLGAPARVAARPKLAIPPPPPPSSFRRKPPGASRSLAWTWRTTAVDSAVASGGSVHAGTRQGGDELRESAVRVKDSGANGEAAPRVATVLPSLAAAPLSPDNAIAACQAATSAAARQTAATVPAAVVAAPSEATWTLETQLISSALPSTKGLRVLLVILALALLAGGGLASLFSHRPVARSAPDEHRKVERSSSPARSELQPSPLLFAPVVTPLVNPTHARKARVRAAPPSSVALGKPPSHAVAERAPDIERVPDAAVDEVRPLCHANGHCELPENPY